MSKALVLQLYAYFLFFDDLYSHKTEHLINHRSVRNLTNVRNIIPV